MTTKTELLVSLLALLTTAMLLIFPATAAPPPTAQDTEFIHSSCQKCGEYPDVCFNSLSPYAYKIHNNSAKLARVAISVSLTRAKHMANYVSRVSRQADFGADHRAAAAVAQCYSVFGDAMDSMHDSLNEMQRLGLARSRESFRFRLSNVQTWMSGALTSEETCLDGFEGMVDGPTISNIRYGTDILEKVTSVALCMVNKFVEQVMQP